MEPRHPVQPLVTDAAGVRRFKKNAIVTFLLEKGSFDMNDLARLPFANEDREQFAMLIGYSRSGFDDLSYASDATIERVDGSPTMDHKGPPRDSYVIGQHGVVTDPAIDASGRPVYCRDECICSHCNTYSEKLRETDARVEFLRISVLVSTVTGILILVIALLVIGSR